MVQALARIDSPITLVDLDSEVVVVVDHGVVGNIAHIALSTTADPGRVPRFNGVCTRPDFEPGGGGRVGHCVVVDVQVGDDVILVGVVAERPDRDTVGSIAVEALDEDVGTIWFERDAVVVVVYH